MVVVLTAIECERVYRLTAILWYNRINEHSIGLFPIFRGQASFNLLEFLTTNVRRCDMAFIQITNITKSYSQVTGDIKQVFEGLNLEIEEAESIVILGEQGSGKSTLLRLLADLDQPDSGSIVIDGQSPREVRLTNSFGMVFQTPVLYDWRTVRRNICMPMEIVDMPKQQRTARIDELLVIAGLEGYGKKYPFELSSELQQRVGIARALTLNPKILYMDDPFSEYDTKLRSEMNKWLKALVQTWGKLMVFTTTDIEEAAYLGDRVLMLSPDKVEENPVITFEKIVGRSMEWKDDRHQLRIEQVKQKMNTTV